jgi:hypothetical protein
VELEATDDGDEGVAASLRGPATDSPAAHEQQTGEDGSSSGGAPMAAWSRCADFS